MRIPFFSKRRKNIDPPVPLTPAESWLQSAQARLQSGVPGSLLDLLEPPAGVYALEGSKSVIAQYRQQVAMRDELQRLIAQVTTLHDPLEKFKMLRSIEERHPEIAAVGITQFAGARRTVMQEVTTELIEQAASGSHTSFAELFALTKGAKRKKDTSIYYQWTAEHYEFDSEWNDLVARYIEHPSLKHFKGLPRKINGIELLYMAVATRRTKSLRDAKIVIAYCSKVRWRYSRDSGDYVAERPYRMSLGELLVNDMAEIIDAAHLTHPYTFVQ